MKKTVIFCYSIHHGNTKKLAEAIKERCGAEVVMLPCKETPDLKDYELVGFASGIYMSAFGDPILTFTDEIEGLNGKDCFTMYTSGANSDKLDRSMLKKLEGAGAHIVGRFSCRGFDTFGPFKLVGGLQKGHPDATEVEAAVSFCEKLMA
ncbi:MAG: flavodoxin domain-containing protein [Oscillospiraceae bacterium]